MPKVMLINVTHSEESRVGIMNDGVLESFEIESVSRSHLKGNLYKGVVHRIHPALEAAFVDIGADKDAFLPLDEICFNNLDSVPKANGSNGNSGGRRSLRIRDVLRPGQELLVQITKEQFANKPPTVTTFYSLPGRYLVLLPGSEDTGISRRIEGEERDRLRKIVDGLKPDEGFGLIVRTVAGLEDNGNDLPRDLEYLRRLWNNVRNAANGQRGPSLVYREHDIVQRAIRDFYTPDISEIHIDDEDAYDRARGFLGTFMPGSEAVLRHYRGEQPMFSAFKVEEQIESVFARRVRLRSGGSIVIDGTEALTAIDVNSGGAVRGANPEETAFRTNREAAVEVARQLRLRDIGGIIVVDFIDMRESKNIREIEQLMKHEMRLDKARHETSRLSSLGLMQISRQRMRPAATASSHATCTHCQGFGSVRTSASAALGALRSIHNRMSLGDVETMRIRLPKDVGLHLLNHMREDVAGLESRYQSTVEIELCDTFLPHEIETEVKERSRTQTRRKAVEPGSVAEARETSKPADARETSKSADADGDGKRRRRRRRRRGGNGSSGDADSSQTNSAEAASSESSASTVDRGRSRSGASEESSKKSTETASTETAARETASTETASTETPASVSSASEATTQAAGDSGNGEKPESSSAESGRRGRSRSRGRRGGRRHRSGRSGAQQEGNSSQANETASPESSARQSAEERPRRTEAVERTRAQKTAGDAAKSNPSETQAAAPPVAATKPAPTVAATKPSARPVRTETAIAREPVKATKAPATRKPAAKKTTAKKATPRKAAAKKTTAKKTTTKKAAAKKTTAKKTTARKTAAKKTTAKKTTKKAAPKAAAPAVSGE